MIDGGMDISTKTSRKSTKSELASAKRHQPPSTQPAQRTQHQHHRHCTHIHHIRHQTPAKTKPHRPQQNLHQLIALNPTAFASPSWLSPSLAAYPPAYNVALVESHKDPQDLHRPLGSLGRDVIHSMGRLGPGQPMRPEFMADVAAEPIFSQKMDAFPCVHQRDAICDTKHVVALSIHIASFASASVQLDCLPHRRNNHITLPLPHPATRNTEDQTPESSLVSPGEKKSSFLHLSPSTMPFFRPSLSPFYIQPIATTTTTQSTQPDLICIARQIFTSNKLEQDHKEAGSGGESPHLPLPAIASAASLNCSIRLEASTPY